MYRHALGIGSVCMMLVIAGQMQAARAAGMTDPAQERAEKLWAPERRQAIIQVRIQTVKTGHVDEQKFGTAFMVSEVIALTAAHVVCDPATKKQRSGVRLFVGGPGSGDGVEPTVIGCYPDNADLAMMKVPNLNAGRPFIKLGAYEDLKGDPFVTIFGYGGAQPGRPLKGNAVFPLDNANRVRVDINAADGDSGAPVLDRTGRAVGVLTAGNAVAAAFIPLRMFWQHLERLSISMPRVGEGAPQPVDINARQKPQTDLAARGIVRLNLGKGPDGKWIVPPSRPATRGEVQVLFTMHHSPSNSESVTFTTEEDGTWVLPLPSRLPRSGIRYAAVATQVDDLDKLPDQYLYRRDPRYGELTADTLRRPIAFDLYARPAYVRYHFAQANARAELLLGGREWKACAALFATPPAKAPGCSRKSPDMLSAIQRQVTEAEDGYSRAFEATSAGSGDADNATSIATAWSNFRFSTGRACRAVVSMQSLFEKFPNKNSAPSVVLQTLNMIVRCLQMPGTSASAVMPWSKENETRQVAAVRLIMEILSSYAAEPAVLQPNRRAVIREVATAFERYTPKVVQVSEAARTIQANHQLSVLFGDFVNRYAIPWCGKRITQPGPDAAVIQKTLVDLRSMVTTCP